MSEPCKSFASSVIDPSLTAMDVDCTSTAKDSVPDVVVAGPALRQEDPRNLEARQTVPPERAQQARMPLPTGNDAPASGHTPDELVGVTAAMGGPRPRHAFRHMEFTHIYTEYLIAFDLPSGYPAACLRIARDFILQLGDIYVVRLAYADFRRRVTPLIGAKPLSDDDWAVIAYHLVPDAPPDGTVAGAWKTTREIADQVHDIHDRLLLPVYMFWLWKGRGAHLAPPPHLVPATTDRRSHPPERTRVLPAQTETSRSSALGSAIASPASVSCPQDAPPHDVPHVPVGSTAVPPTRLELSAQLVQSLYHSYLTVWAKRPMPSDAERTVAGKVIDIFMLMAVMNGCYKQLGRRLTLGDIGGLAVSHFGYPRHTRILVDSPGRRRLAFWASTPEVAFGLWGLYARHLRGFVLSPYMQAGAWGIRWGVLMGRLGIWMPVHEEEPQDFLQLTDIAAGIPPDTPGARAAGLVAIESPGVTRAVDRSPLAQRLFALTLGFSPISDIQQRVLARLVKDPRDSFWGDPVQPFNLGSMEAQQWLARWKEFLGHRERALVIGRKRIHETLKDDTETEKLLFMLAAYDSMHLGECRSPPTEAQLEAAALGFPPRHLVTENTLEAWNADFVRIWEHLDRLVGPLASPPRATGFSVPRIVAQPGKAMQEARKATRPLHKAHEMRHRALPKKSATWVATPKLLTRTKSSVI